MAHSIGAGRVVRDVNAVVEHLTGLGLVNRSRFAIRRTIRGIEQVTFEGASEISVAIKDVPYAEIYRLLVEQGAYNVRMLDGGLLQMGYYFKHGQLWKHRLAFFPSPDTGTFQNDIRACAHDNSSFGSAEKNVVPIPVRFDFSTDRIKAKWPHPQSHLNLGQFTNCRIPVSAPVSPLVFADFVLRSFYSISIADTLPKNGIFFDQTIAPSDTDTLHVVVPYKR